jgi:antitoxin (DNA-binding transcriptional repressor) of toxin-antitoxin stability system
MSTTIPLAEAAANLADLVAGLRPGDEVVLTQHERPVAKLLVPDPPPEPRRPGSAKGLLTVVSDDDDHLADFAEYMP